MFTDLMFCNLFEQFLLRNCNYRILNFVGKIMYNFLDTIGDKLYINMLTFCEESLVKIKKVEIMEQLKVNFI